MAQFWTYRFWRAPFYFASGSRTDYGRTAATYVTGKVDPPRIIPQFWLTFVPAFSATGEATATVTTSLTVPATVTGEGTASATCSAKIAPSATGEATAAASPSAALACSATGAGSASSSCALAAAGLALGSSSASATATASPTGTATGVSTATAICALSIAPRATGEGFATCTARPTSVTAPILCLVAGITQPLELFATAGPALFLEATSRPELLLEPGLLSGAAVPALLLEAWVEAC